MSWFGLFDRLRLRNSAEAQGLAMPGSQLLLADPNIAALYRDAIHDQGESYRADLFDIAGHYLARGARPAAGAYHLDIRLTGRPQRILFHGDAGHGLIAWHAESGAGALRMAGGGDAVALDAMALLPLLRETIEVRAITSLSIWSADVAAAVAMLRELAPRLVRETRVILRLPPEALAEALRTLPGLPAHCAAVLPCIGAADQDGRGEEPTTLLLCLEQLSERADVAALPLQATQRDLWNARDRADRLVRHGGVGPQLPLPDRGLTGGWTIAVAGEIPPTPVGLATSGLQSTAFRAQPGFDYVLDITSATVVVAGGIVYVVPQDGPVVVQPHLVPGADAVQPMARDALVSGLNGMLRACGVSDGQGYAATRARPVSRVSQRTAFLLTAACAEPLYVSEVWPSLEHAFQFCERNRLTLADIDILVPGGATRLVRESLSLIGVPDASIVTDTDPVLYRHILVTSPASRSDAAQRAAAYDQFWARVRGVIRTDSHASFTRMRRSDRLMLTGGTGPALLNATTLHTLARRRGYEVFDPSGVSFGEAAAILGGARAIVGFGAQLGWTCLARTAAVGVIQADNDFLLPFAALHAASANGFGVAATFGSGIGETPPVAVSLAPDRFEALLDRLDAASTGARTRMTVSSEAAR